MSVLAIEQGKTNTLFELKPRELFQRVLEMLGDHAILERYREARRRYEDTDRELMRQVMALHAKQAELAAVQREVQRLAAWEAARDKVAELQARLPAAELQGLLTVRRDATSKSRELQTKVRQGEIAKGSEGSVPVALRRNASTAAAKGANSAARAGQRRASQLRASRGAARAKPTDSATRHSVSEPRQPKNSQGKGATTP